jgi:hypothetical protein
MDGALFVPDQDVLDIFVPEQLVIDVHDGTTRIPEDGIHIFLFQDFKENLCSC